MQQAKTMNENRTASRGRTCVGCGLSGTRDVFVRLVLVPSSAPVPAPLPATPAEPHAESIASKPEPRSSGVVADLAGGSFGRGAHVHPKMDCIERACRTGLSKSFKMRVAANPLELRAQIIAAAERRIGGLVMAARRTRGVAVGADATCDALDKGARVVLIAKDAGSVLGRHSIQRAVADGRSVVWGDKERLGALLGEATVAVSAITYGEIANSILSANALIQSLGQSPGEAPSVGAVESEGVQR